MSTDLLASVTASNSVPTPTPVITPAGSDPLKQLSGNYTMFLKLLTTQLQYQDPLNPTDATTYTQQLVSYSQVEQQIKTNDQIGNLINATKANNNSHVALLNYLGHYVTVDGKDFVLQDGEANMTFQLTGAASNVALDILDQTGKKVASFRGAGGAGVQKISWDGKDSDGDQLPDGAYRLQITATDVNDKAVGVKNQSMIGKVTGVERGIDGNILFIGNTSVDEGKITSVYNSPGDVAA